MAVCAGSAGPARASGGVLLGFFNGRGLGPDYAIGAARSVDAVHWRAISSAPVLRRGTGWDAGGVKDPWAVRAGGRVYLYYSGYDASPRQRRGIGLALSDDGGRTFKRAGREPVIRAGAGDPVFPVVQRTGGSWRMWYTARAGHGRTAIDLATSRDGLRWRRARRSFVSGRPRAWDGQLIETGSVVHVRGRYVLFYGGDHLVSGRDRWSVGIATALRPGGPFRRVGSRPVLRGSGVATRLSAPARPGVRELRVAAAARFRAGGVVLVTAGTRTHVARVVHVRAHRLLLAAPLPWRAPAGSAVRDAASWSVSPRTVFRRDGRWLMTLTLFQQVPRQLHELTGFATAPTLGGPWRLLPTRTLGVGIGRPGSWDELSAENLAVAG